MNIAIIRAFVFIRQYTLNHQDLRKKLDELEKRYNERFQDIYEVINYLLKKEKEITEHQHRIIILVLCIQSIKFDYSY